MVLLATSEIFGICLLLEIQIVKDYNHTRAFLRLTKVEVEALRDDPVRSQSSPWWPLSITPKPSSPPENTMIVK